MNERVGLLFDGGVAPGAGGVAAGGGRTARGSKVDRGGVPPALDRERMYRAIAERDGAYRGVFYVGVKTTGVFCRVGCPSRVPKIDNCEFFSSVAGALQAGYRACLRCKPCELEANAPAWAGRILDMMEREPSKLVTGAEVRRAGGEPAAAARYFSSKFGVTLQAMSRARRVGLAMKWLRAGGDMRGAMRTGGFESESGLRKAVQELFGVSVGQAIGRQTDPIIAAWVDSPLGPMLAGASERGVCLLEFVDRRGLATQLDTLRKRMGRPIVPGSHDRLEALKASLRAYFTLGSPNNGVRTGTDPLREIELEVPGTAFQRQVWEELRRVPLGETCTYAELARRIGRPSAVRAVAKANGDNRVALVLACHRIVGTSGDLTGYAGGLWRKRWLLEHERAMTR